MQKQKQYTLYFIVANLFFSFQCFGMAPRGVSFSRVNRLGQRARDTGARNIELPNGVRYKYSPYVSENSGKRHGDIFDRRMTNINSKISSSFSSSNFDMSRFAPNSSTTRPEMPVAAQLPAQPLTTQVVKNEGVQSPNISANVTELPTPESEIPVSNKIFDIGDYDDDFDFEDDVETKVVDNLETEVIDIEALQDFDKIIQFSGNRLILVKCCKKASMRSRKIVEPLRELSLKYKDEMVFLSIDVAKFPDFAQQHDAKKLPVFLVFKDGIVIDRLSEATPDMLKLFIETVIVSNFDYCSESTGPAEHTANTEQN